MNFYTLRRYATTSDEEPSLEYSFCSSTLFNKSGNPVYSNDYNENEELLLKRLSDRDYVIKRGICAEHPVCDLWRNYLVFDPQTAMTMPEKFSREFSWRDALAISDLDKTEHPIKLAFPRNVAKLDWKEVLIEHLERTMSLDEATKYFVDVNEDEEMVAYEIFNLDATDLTIFRLENDPAALTFFTADFLNWLFTLVPEQGFLP